MSGLIRNLLLGLFCGWALAGCKADTDLGQPCRMTKPCQPGPTCPIPESEVSDASLNYVALGASECDDLVCVRTANSANPSGGESGEAYGYCTKSCIDATDCEYDYQGNKDNLGCQQLLLSNMQQLKESNPEAYERMFGSGASSKYCVKK